MTSSTTEVTFGLADDGERFWFRHWCEERKDWKPTPDPDGGAPYEWNPVKATLPVGPDGWTIVQREPLTVTPSIQCGSCSCHSFITNGQWVAA